MRSMWSALGYAETDAESTNSAQAVIRRNLMVIPHIRKVEETPINPVKL